MKLSLLYNKHLNLPIGAAFIRGGQITTWLQEITRWNIPLDTFDCYVMPESIQSISPAGLFIVFRDNASIKHLQLLEPFACIADNVFIPVDAELVPKVTKAELQAFLLWDVQVFHPAIGMVGFESSNKLPLENLFIYNNQEETDWSFANPGLLSKPEFNKISIVQPTAEELIDSIKNEIGQKPLDDIPKNKEEDTSVIEKIADTVKYGLFKSIYTVTSLVTKILPENNGSNSSSTNEGLLQQLQNWLLQNMDVLEKKRNDEITRLMNLFNENTDEALQYAIPLNSPYFNRGSQTVSTRLSRNNTSFNLGKLGGGGVTDSWDLGDRYQDLRTKYINAAQKEMKQGNYKKAAYVYAHLLGDYLGAANVLVQGNMHREAAALYKDHFKNIPAAAECLEKGGLYIEAIELYKEMDRTEKVGDLYKSLEQETQAEKYYEQHIDKQLSNNDYLDAARVMDDKLDQHSRAEETLLQGWGSSYQHENCLKKYFDMSLAQTDDITEQKVKQVYSKHTPQHKKISFLNVLEHVAKKKKDKTFAFAAQEMAYEIVHEETEAGNLQLLNSLKKFLPEDKLIGSDTSRYISKLQKRPVAPATNKNFYLDQSIKWIKAVWHRNHFLALGIKNNCLHMARGNWYQNIEYYTWTNEIKANTRFNFINAPYYSNHIIIHSSDGLPITRKNLPKNKYFTDSLVVYCPIWLHKTTAQFLIDEEEQITKLDISNGDVTLHHYSLSGDLKKSTNCISEGEYLDIGNVASNPVMIKGNDYFYSYKNKQIFSIAKNGLIKSLDIDSIIRFVASTVSPSELYIIISTNKGCLLSKPKGENIDVQTDYFAEDLIPTAITFISNICFVIVDKNTAHLYEIINEQPIQKREIKSATLIIATLPATNSLEFAILEEDGRTTIHNINES